MNISKRALLRSTILFAGVGTLAACSQSTINTIQVTLAVAQAEGATIFAALQAVLPRLSSAGAQAVMAKATAILNQLQVDVTNFAGVPAGGSWESYAKAVIADVSDILGIVSGFIPAPTLVAINAGLGIITALLAGVSTVTIPAASANVGASGSVVPGPIPIPVS